MKAIILAAGYATRLYPITENKPKALLPIQGKPIIQYIVDEINEINEIDCIYVVSNNKFYDHFKEWASVATSSTPVKIINDETNSDIDRKGAIGDIYLTLESMQIDEDVMIIAGDNFFTYKLKDYYNYYISNNMDSVIVKKYDDLEKIKSFAVAKIDENKIIIDLEEKPEHPKSDIVVYATYIYKKETLKLFKRYLEEGNDKDAPGNFVVWLYKLKPVIAYEMIGDCYDIGTREIYDLVQSIDIK
jgi:glucose-1-phosphate thymidylyltransferase